MRGLLFGTVIRHIDIRSFAQESSRFDRVTFALLEKQVSSDFNGTVQVNEVAYRVILDCPLNAGERYQRLLRVGYNYAFDGETRRVKGSIGFRVSAFSSNPIVLLGKNRGQFFWPLEAIEQLQFGASLKMNYYTLDREDQEPIEVPHSGWEQALYEE